MTNGIEKNGIALLKRKLSELGHSVTTSDNKTYDLIVDGTYAEVKTKNKPSTNLDFISLTDKQFEEVSKNDFMVYLVCNVENEEKVEFYKIPSKLLREITPKIYTSYEYNKSEIDKIKIKL